MGIKSLGAPEKMSVPGQLVFRSIFGTFKVLLTKFSNPKMEFFKSREFEIKIRQKLLIRNRHLFSALMSFCIL